MQELVVKDRTTALAPIASFYTAQHVMPIPSLLEPQLLVFPDPMLAVFLMAPESMIAPSLASLL